MMNHSDGVESGKTLRSLGPLEEVYWLYHQATPFHFIVAAEVEAQAREGEWRAALDVLQGHHPIFAAAVSETAAGRLFVGRPDVRILLRIVHDDSCSGWEAEIGLEMATPFRPTDAPLVRATVVLGSPKTVIMLAANHAIADGVSTAHALEQLVRILAGESFEAVELSPALETRLAGDGGETGLHEDRLLVSPAQAPSQPAQEIFAVPSIKSLSLSQDETDRLWLTARRNGTTLHAALCAALVEVGRRNESAWRDHPIRILAPINLRPLVGLDARPVLAIAVGVLYAPSGPQVEFWSLARRLKAELTQVQAPAALMDMGQAIGRLAAEGLDAERAADFMIANFTSEAMVTNLGRLPFRDRYGEIKLKALWGPAVLTGSEGEQVIGVNTVGGQLHLLHASHKPMPSLLEEMKALLHQVAMAPSNAEDTPATF